MRANLKRDDPEGSERWRLYYRHILGCLDGGSGYIRPGARSDVRHAGIHSLPNRVKNAKIVKRFQQTKGVAAANKDDFGIIHGCDWFECLMDRGQFVTHTRKTFFCGSRVSVAIVERVGNKQNALFLAQEISNLLLGMIEITAAIQS